MIGGRNLLLLSGAIAAASCTTTHRVEVRAIPRPGVTLKTGDSLLAQARGQLALGDVGLALENFRTLQREQPENPDVFEGIAQCYAAMSRYDLVRTNLEFALAYEPNDPKLLIELASALDAIGERDRAAQARAEATRLQSPPARPVLAQNTLTPMGVARVGSVTVKLPELSPRPVHAAAPHTVVVPVPATPGSATLVQAAPFSDRKPPVETASLRSSLPLPMPSPPPPEPPAVPARPMDSTAPEPPAEQHPYLERTSRGEVALVTMQPAPVERPIEHTPRSLALSEPRWVPLKATEPQYVELLNAARRQNLAAQTRMALLNHGWRRIGIGDARTVRAHSLVLYGEGRLQLAHRLAAQFRCNARQVAGLKTLVVLLGRDSARRSAGPARA